MIGRLKLILNNDELAVPVLSHEVRTERSDLSLSLNYSEGEANCLPEYIYVLLKPHGETVLFMLP